MKLTSRELQSYFRTEKKPQPRAFEAHGITLEFLQDKPKFSECARQITEFLRGATLVAHNASFDVGFLDAELNRAKTGITISDLVKEIICTVKMSVEVSGSQKSLDALCKLYRIPFDVHEKHSALFDVKLLSQVYLRMHKDLNNQHIDSQHLV